MLGALVIRLGWKSAGGEKTGPSDGKSFTLDAALVDSGAIKQLTAAIEASDLEAVAQRHDAEKCASLDIEWWRLSPAWSTRSAIFVAMSAILGRR